MVYIFGHESWVPIPIQNLGTGCVQALPAIWLVLSSGAVICACGETWDISVGQTYRLHQDDGTLWGFRQVSWWETFSERCRSIVERILETIQTCISPAWSLYKGGTAWTSGPPVFARRRRSNIQEIRSPFGIISRSHRLWFKENTKSICTDSRRSFSGESWNPCQLLENWIAKSFFVWNRPQGRSNSRNLN